MVEELFLSRSPRVRPSPYFDLTLRAGLRGVTVYTHMILPGQYSGMIDEYPRPLPGAAAWE